MSTGPLATTNDPVEVIVDTTPTSEVVYKVSDNTVYKSVDDLFKGAIEKEKYIQQLIEENKNLKQENELKTNQYNFKEELDKMAEVLNKDNSKPVETTNPNELSIEEQVKKALDSERARQTAEANVLKVNEALVKTFGEEADNKLNTKLKEINLSKEDYTRLASTSPDAALKMLEVNKTNMVDLSSIHGKSLHVSNSSPSADSALLEEIKSNHSNPKYMAQIFEKALANPSILNNLKW